MSSNTLHCHICHIVLTDNETTIKQHISSFHLNYRPYDCSTCTSEGNIFKASTEEVIDAHITALHSATNSGYHAIKDQIKEAELKVAIEECRRVSNLQLSSADTTVDCRQSPALNSPAHIDEIVQVTRDSKELLRGVLISLGGTSDTGNISTEMKQDNPETSQGAALEGALRELEQNNAPANDQTLPEAMPDATDRPAIKDCQPALLPVINQQSAINEEQIEEQEIAPNFDFSHLKSINLYSGTVGSTKKPEEARNSGVSRNIIPVSNQAIDNASTKLLEQNEVQMALGSSASDGIIASATSLPTPSESPPLKHAKWPSRQIESRELKSSNASQKPLEVEGMPLKLHLRGQKQVHCWEDDFEAGQNISVERKRIRLSCTGSYTNDVENSNFDSNANRENFLETDISETESQNMPNSNTCVPLQTVCIDNTNIHKNASLKRRLDKLFETVNGLQVQDPTLCLANKLLNKLEDICNVFIKKPPRIPKNTPECVRQRRFYERHKEELNEKRKSTSNITEEQMKKLAPKEMFNVKETSNASFSKENISGNKMILNSFQLLKRC